MKKSASTYVLPHEIREGMIIDTRKGDFYALYDATYNRRSKVQVYGVYERYWFDMKKDPKNTKLMAFHTIKFRSNRFYTDSYKVVGMMSKKDINLGREMSRTLTTELSNDAHAAHKKLNPQYSEKRVVKKHGYTRLGGWELTTKRGEKVGAGDRVMVGFSNGNFPMILGNHEGKVMDGKTGRFYCMSPWKAEKPSRLRTDWTGRIREVKTKARTLPADSLLYLIERKKV